MKKKILNILFVMLMFTFVGCAQTETKESKNETKILVGYIIIKDDNLYFDEVEIINREDTERIAELGLTEEQDYPSGFCILNEDAEESTFKLTSKTEYTFTDLDGTFKPGSESDQFNDRLYTTTKKDEFLKHLGVLNNMPLSEQTIPYTVKLQNGNVISITEEFKYTI